MCLAIPVRVAAVHGEGFEASAAIDGSDRTVSLAMVPGTLPGDYLLVHAGLAVRRLEAAEAQAVIADLGEAAG